MENLVSTPVKLTGLNKLFVRQVHEIAELLGFETRNKYSITDEQGHQIGFAAEQQKGLLGFLFRQFLGHWRTFEVHFFTPQRQLFLIGYHPFRWYFERIEVRTPQGKLTGALQKRFSILTKRFDVENEFGHVVLQVSSPVWRIWTFPFFNHGREVARVQKKWSGLLSEGFTDKDNFLVEYLDPSLSDEIRQLIMSSAVFIDLLYFERKAK